MEVLPGVRAPVSGGFDEESWAENQKNLET